MGHLKMTSQNLHLSLPELPKALLNLAQNPAALLLLAALVLVASRARHSDCIAIASYFALTAVINLISQNASIDGAFIYMTSCMLALSSICVLYVSGDYSLLVKISAVVLLVLCAESGIMAIDELNFKDEITIAYVLDPYIQIAADAMLVIIGGASVFHSVISRSDTGCN